MKELKDLQRNRWKVQHIGGCEGIKRLDLESGSA